VTPEISKKETPQGGLRRISAIKIEISINLFWRQARFEDLPLHWPHAGPKQ